MYSQSQELKAKLDSYQKQPLKAKSGSQQQQRTQLLPNIAQPYKKQTTLTNDQIQDRISENFNNNIGLGAINQKYDNYQSYDAMESNSAKLRRSNELQSSTGSDIAKQKIHQQIMFQQMQQQKIEGNEEKKTNPLTEKQNLLERAKQLLEKSKQDNDKDPQQQNQQVVQKASKTTSQLKKKKKRKNKDNVFLTGVNMAGQSRPRITGLNPNLNGKYEPQEVSDADIINSLNQDYIKSKETDDLAELRRMINETKSNIRDYAEDVFNLKGIVSNLNQDFNEGGYGVDDEIFHDMDIKFNKYMPNGDKSHLFNKIDSAPKVVRNKPAKAKTLASVKKL